MLAAALLLGAASLGYVRYLDHFEDTDNAQIDGDITSLSPRVPGTVRSVFVVENQRVKVGDVLVELDLGDLEAALAAAQAELAAARARFQSEEPAVGILQVSLQSEVAQTSAELSVKLKEQSELRHDLDRLSAELDSAQAVRLHAARERTRAERLLGDGAGTRAQFEASEAADLQAEARVRALQHALLALRERDRRFSAQIGAARASHEEVSSNGPGRLKSREASVRAHKAALESAAAALRQAELNLTYARIVAPVDGIVARKVVAVGDWVQPGQLIMAISQVDRLWVTANFRETQLARIAPGNEADVYVDALDVHVRGWVESIGGATGARLSIFPPENAAGNYVKVVQRVPVRIALERGQPGMERLRPGLSVEPRIDLFSRATGFNSEMLESRVSAASSGAE